MKKEEHIITVKNLSKTFKSVRAVDGIDFSVEKGEFFAFLGPNGAGKSTSIKMLTTLLRPDSGEILVNGYNPLKDQDDVRKSIGIVFQDPSLDNELTAWENLEFHGILYGVEKNVRKERMEYLLKFVGLWDRRNDPIKTYSGGMKRRLEIARGLIHHPTILFLDEPTLGLDPQTRNHIWDYIKDLNTKEKMTVFFTTHYMEEAEKMADRIAIIDDGKIVSIGTSKQITSKTKTKSLEEAFLKLTGKNMREEKSDMGKRRMRETARLMKA